MKTPPRNGSHRHPALAGIVLLALLASGGCAHKPTSPAAAEPDHAGSVGLVHAKFLPEVELDLPAKGRVDGALRGAGRGFLAWMEPPLRAGAEGLRGCNARECGYLAIGVLAVAAASGTVGAVVGGVQGAIHALPGAEARRIEEATRYLADLDIQETMWARTIDVAMGHAGYRIFPLAGGGPTASDCVVDYGGFAPPGIDSIVEVGVISVGFMGEKWGSNPPLSVFLQVRVRRYRPVGGGMVALEEKEFRYRSVERFFPEWMGDGAVRVEEEFQRGYAVLAAEIADWI